MIHIPKLTNYYLTFAQVEGVFSIFEPVKKNCQKKQKLARKSAKYMKNLQIRIKFI